MAARGFQKCPLLASSFHVLCTDNIQAENKSTWDYLTLCKHNKRSHDTSFPYITTTLQMDARSNSEKHLTTNHHESLKWAILVC